MYLRAVVAPCLPLAAPCERKVNALSRKWPAVVKRPDDLDVVLLDELKEHRDIYEAVVNIMDMNDVRIKLLNLTEEIPCRDYRQASVIARIFAELLMKIMRDLISDIDRIRISLFISARVITANGLVAF